MNLELLVEELREYLEPKIITSFNIFNEVSRPSGYGESFLTGMVISYRVHMEQIGCTLLDVGETEEGHIGICFRFDRTGHEFQAVSGLDDGVTNFKIFALEQWVPNEEL